MDCSLPVSSVHGVSQARILEWVVMPSSRRSSQSKDRTWGSCIGRQILHRWATREALQLLYLLLLFSLLVLSNSLWAQVLQHSRLLCPPLSFRVCSDSCPLSWWCYLAVSSSVAPFSCPQSFPSIRVFSNDLALHIMWPNIGASVQSFQWWMISNYFVYPSGGKLPAFLFPCSYLKGLVPVPILVPVPVSISVVNTVVLRSSQTNQGDHLLAASIPFRFSGLCELPYPFG